MARPARAILESKPFLVFESEIGLPAIEKFVFDRQMIKANCGTRGPGFQFPKDFFGMEVPDTPATPLKAQLMPTGLLDREILKHFEGMKDFLEVGIAHILWLLNRQPGGESGFLRTDETCNVFYVRNKNGELRTVKLIWEKDHWHIESHMHDYPDPWPDRTVLITG